MNTDRHQVVLVEGERSPGYGSVSNSMMINTWLQTPAVQRTSTTSSPAIVRPVSSPWSTPLMSHTASAPVLLENIAHDDARQATVLDNGIRYYVMDGVQLMNEFGPTLSQSMVPAPPPPSPPQSPPSPSSQDVVSFPMPSTRPQSRMLIELLSRPGRSVWPSGATISPLDQLPAVNAANTASNTAANTGAVEIVPSPLDTTVVPSLRIPGEHVTAVMEERRARTTAAARTYTTMLYPTVYDNAELCRLQVFLTPPSPPLISVRDPPTIAWPPPPTSEPQQIARDQSDDQQQQPASDKPEDQPQQSASDIPEDQQQEQKREQQKEQKQ